MIASNDPLEELLEDLQGHISGWFAEVQSRVAAGEPFAIVQATTPQELLRAMDIPLVVNQWWAMVVSQAGAAAEALSSLSKLGYPDDHLQYHSLAFASVLGEGAAPWGGLPTPTIAITENYYGLAKVAELWALERGAAFFRLEHTVSNVVPTNWWDLGPSDWEQLVGAERLDLLQTELEHLVRFLEQTTGKRFSQAAFEQILARVNEQESWNRQSRNLIAATVPPPMSMLDSVRFVMAHQWWRGSEWALDAARRFNAEVRRRVAAGETACEQERIRLMWLGPPPWFATDLFPYLETEYGAVFVWSNYLSIAADGYLRFGGEPMRSLAARFAVMHDELGMPPWNVEWYAKEAVLHQVDGAVSMGGDGRYGSYFAAQALGRVGVPLLQIDASNVDDQGSDAASVRDVVQEFIEREVQAVADRRRRRAGGPSV